MSCVILKGFKNQTGKLFQKGAGVVHLSFGGGGRESKLPAPPSPDFD